VGSSNLSARALREGIEWNYRVVPSESRKGFQSIAGAFERLFLNLKTRSLDIDWINNYEKSRRPPSIASSSETHPGIHCCPVNF
jgi:HKD family nuclease